MLEALKRESTRTCTENGGAAWSTTMSDCLDLFSTVGALRGASWEEIQDRFTRAWAEDRDTAVKIAFFARDVRGGLGERYAFRIILKAMARLSPETVVRNLGNIPEYGRWDDLLALFDTPCKDASIAYIRAQLAKDVEAMESGEGNVSLMAKWLPSVNASSPDTLLSAKILVKGLGMTEATYRKTLSALRARIAILENNLRERDYTFDYAKQPSKAMLKYRQAFLRNDGERYQDFLRQVCEGKEALHTDTLYPYDVIAPVLVGKVMSQTERLALDTTWKALPDYTGGGNALVVADESGSMYSGYVRPIPAAVALSLAIYFAQRNTGAFRNHFITFSRSPRLVEIKGEDLYEQVHYCAGFNECANTNLQAVFDLLLRTAVENHMSQADIPDTLYVISDMEFDEGTERADVTAFEQARRAFAAEGYQLPQVVFWNVASRGIHQPVTMNEQGAVLVSGCTPRLFQMVTEGEFSSYAYMMDVLSAPRYRDLTA